MSFVTQVQDYVTRAATESKALRTLINNNQADLTALNTAEKSNLVAAINELVGAVGGASGIDDGTISGSSTWSSLKIDSEITAVTPSAATTTAAGIVELATNTETETGTDTARATTPAGVTAAIALAIADLTDSAPTTLDTLNEIAAALGDDPNFAATITTALGMRVSVESQTFTEPQQLQARTNIGAQAAADIGDTATDFVALFEAGLV